MLCVRCVQGWLNWIELNGEGGSFIHPPSFLPSIMTRGIWWNMWTFARKYGTVYVNDVLIEVQCTLLVGYCVCVHVVQPTSLEHVTLVRERNFALSSHSGWLYRHAVPTCHVTGYVPWILLPMTIMSVLQWKQRDGYGFIFIHLSHGFFFYKLPSIWYYVAFFFSKKEWDQIAFFYFDKISILLICLK